MVFIYYILCAVLIYFSYRSLRGGINYFNYFKRELAKDPSRYTPFATIIAPCKGLDSGLRENLQALMEQEYPAYDVTFVVDDADDPAVSVIEGVLQKCPPNAGTLIVAGKTRSSSQKVENLREAVLHTRADSRVYVFVDSDARPSTAWLRHLIAPLEDENVGAATGYRWFISERPGFAGELRSTWNASIASALGPERKSNFCWGGSTAIRRDTFERLEIREKWLGTLSDDFVVTRLLKEAHLPVVFVPQALTASIEDCTFRELLEFTTRQMKITRVYASKLWALSFLSSALFNLVMISCVLILAVNGSGFVTAAFAGTTLATVTLLSLAKSTIRLNAVMLVMDGYSPQLKRQYATHNLLTLLTPALFLYNCIAALLSRTLTWRDRTYRLVAADRTEVVTAGSKKDSAAG